MSEEATFVKIGEYVVNPAAIAYVKFPQAEHDRAHMYFRVPHGSDGAIAPRHITLRGEEVTKLWRWLTPRSVDLDSPDA
jgi:hypothetical protein